MNRIVKYIAGITIPLFLSVSSALADKICVAGNFDGDQFKAERVVDFCEEENVDAMLLMGDYSARELEGKRNFKTDFASTKRVLDKFGKFGKTQIPVFVLSGSNDRLKDVKNISEDYPNMHALEDNVQTPIADMNVIPLNGYDNKNFMFEGAKFIKPKQLKQYLKTLKKNPNSVAITHIAPYGDVDIIFSGINVGNKRLEEVLRENGINSISNAIRESPSKTQIGKRWKINPSVYLVILDTDGKGQIKEVEFYNVTE